MGLSRRKPTRGTLQNSGTEEFLVADGAWTVSTAPTISNIAYWNIVTYADGSLSFQNVSNGRYLDGDRSSVQNDFNPDADLSEGIQLDDGWFVTAVG